MFADIVYNTSIRIYKVKQKAHQTRISKYFTV